MRVAFGRYRWPGNVRQLASVVRTAVALLDDGDDTLTLAQMGCELGEAPDAAPARPAPEAKPAVGNDLRKLADARIRETLAAVDGNVSEAARRLGVSRNTLYRRLRS